MLKTGYDQLATRLAQITGLRVFNDPRTINAPCIVLEAPIVTMHTNVVAEMEFRVVVIAQGTGDKRTLNSLLDQADLIRAAQIGLTSGRPTTASYGGLDYSAYELIIATKVAP